MSGKGRQSYHGGSYASIPSRRCSDSRNGILLPHPINFVRPGEEYLALTNSSGVPRIMEGTLPAHFRPAETDDAIMSATKRFMSTARININARQVFPPGFKRPDRDA